MEGEAWQRIAAARRRCLFAALGGWIPLSSFLPVVMCLAVGLEKDCKGFSGAAA